MTLKLTIEREVKPTEVLSLVWGTGALSWTWWKGASIYRPITVDNVVRYELIEINDIFAEGADIRETDHIFVVVDDPDYEEGSGKTKTVNLSMQRIIHAASRAMRGDGARIDEESARDMRTEDLGYADAIAGDAVLQLAVFGEIVYG